MMTAVATSECISRVEKHAHELSAAPADYDWLLDRIGERRIVLLGEASHGTHEFYGERIRFTRRLVQQSAAPGTIKKAAVPGKGRNVRRRLPKKTGTASGRPAGNVKGRGKQVLFVQGGGKDVHDSWDNKLVASLEQGLGPGYVIRYPRMPGEDDPDPEAWKRAIAREVGKLSDHVILVAHSVGAAIVLDFLADGDLERQFAGVFLIATPFIGDGGWPSDDLRPTKELVADLPDGLPLYLYQGDDDDIVPLSHIGLFKKALPHATIRRFEGYNHQLNDNLSEVAHDIRLLE
jgi:predicted alpha/beta hydrolase family esterase